MRFKSFLTERIYHQGDDLVITIQHSRETTTDEVISTFMRRVPYETHFKGSGDVTIYSILNYVSSGESTKLLSSLKGRGPYRVNEKQLDFFLDQVVEACSKLVSVVKPDIIIHPRSSSRLVAAFATKLHLKYPRTELITDAFVKKLLDSSNVEPLINTSHPDWKKFSETRPVEVEKLKLSLKKQIEAHGTLELKKLYKPYLKFIKNFIQLESSYEILEKVLAKRVLVVDDLVSSGATMAEMIRQLQELEPTSLAGLTIFKRTVAQG